MNVLNIGDSKYVLLGDYAYRWAVYAFGDRASIEKVLKSNPKLRGRSTVLRVTQQIEVLPDSPQIYEAPF